MIPVKRQHVSEIEVAEYVSVEYDEGIIKEALRILHCASCSQWCLFDRIGQTDVEFAPVIEMTLDVVGEITYGEYDLVDVMFF